MKCPLQVRLLKMKLQKKKMKSVLNRRRHLILLAQNQEGLQNIFRMISTSYVGDNFYRYPRVDYSLLRSTTKESLLQALV